MGMLTGRGYAYFMDDNTLIRQGFRQAGSYALHRLDTGLRVTYGDAQFMQNRLFAQRGKRCS